MKLPKIEIPAKPKYMKISETEDFFSLFSKIEAESENCFILESLGEESYISRYSIIGFAPAHIISARKNILKFDKNEFKVQNPYDSLREIVPQNVISRAYSGGLIGFISYEAMNYFEPSLKLPEHEDFEQFKFGVFLDGLVYDKMTGEIFYFYFEKDRSDYIKKILKKEHPKRQKPKIKFLGDSSTKDEHKETVDKVLEEIKKGNTFQCEVGFKSNFEISKDSFAIYEELRRINPSPHMYYIKFKYQKIIGASPELLFRLRNGEMETFPLAGTTLRGRDIEEDKAFARKLLNDPKEIAEHNMLIDLHRNDLGRAARFGTVKVRSAMDIKKFSHVQHISSEIVGIIDNKNDMYSALASCFPAGTLTGAPKIESMKIIAGNEKNPRGPYGGAVGHFGFNGNCTFAIPIRTLFVNGNKGYTQTSGGIVADSKPANEYEEIQNKLAAMKKVLKYFEE